MSMLNMFGNLRIAVGLGAWLLPQGTVETFGVPFSSEAGPALGLRLFGIREICLGGFLAYGDQSPIVLKQWLLMNIICDAADIIACIIYHQSLPKGGSAKFLSLFLGGAVFALACGVYLRQNVQ